jgi:hypothetical protein
MKSARRGIRFSAPSGAEDCSPGRKPWERRPTPRPASAGHPSPARAGEGKGEREGSPTHGSRRGLSSTAPIGAVEPFSQYGIYAMNFSYRTLGQFTIHNPGLPQHQVPSPWRLTPIHSSRPPALFPPALITYLFTPSPFARIISSRFSTGALPSASRVGLPSPKGRGWPATALSTAVAGRVWG